MQKIISIILVVCLLVAFTTSASAADIYSTTPESAPLSMTPSLMSTYDSGVSVAAVEPSDLNTYLRYGSYTVAQYLAGIVYYLTGSSIPSFTGTSFITKLDEIFNDYLEVSGWYLDDDGDVNNLSSVNSISQLVRRGFLGLSTNLKSISSSISNLNIKDYSSILTSISNSVDGLESGLSSANTAIGGVTSAVNNVRTAVNNVVSGLSTVNTSVNNVNASVGTVNTSVNAVNTSVGTLNTSLNSLFQNEIGWNYLSEDGTISTARRQYSLTAFVLSGFSGLRNVLLGQLITPADNYFLNSSGTLSSTSANSSFIDIYRSGMIGLWRSIVGSETDNIYASTLYDNNNTTTTVNSTGLGPLLNTQLSYIGENLGHLAYVFASDEDIKLREESQPLLDTTDSFYDDSNSNVKVSANNVGSLKDIAGNFTSIIDTDADIGDAFTIVSNSNTYRWFSADTAMNLDSLGVSTVDFDESTYDRLHREFNEIYFPDRAGGAS